MNLEQKFLNALEKNDAETAKDILNDYCKKNKKVPKWNFSIPLYIVKFPELLKIVFDHGADINEQVQNKGYSALINACRLGLTESVRIILKYNPDTHLVSFAGLPALFYAIDLKNDAIIKMLIEYENNIDFLKDIIEFCKYRNIDLAKYTDLFNKKIKEK